MFEALNPYDMVPISTQNIYKVIKTFSSEYGGIWIHHHAITTTLVGPDLESQLKSLVTFCYQTKPLCIS